MKNLWQIAFGELLKGTMTSYWRSIHSLHYQKPSRRRSQGNLPGFSCFSKSLLQKAVQREQTTAKSRNKSSSEKTSLSEELSLES